jgi:hypothetical protein
LGFAFYEEGDFGKAYSAWSEAFSLADKEYKGAVNSNFEKVTAEAGIALSLLKISVNTQKGKDKAIGLRNQIIQENPSAFSPDGLSKNWRWTDRSIADWNKLLTLK